MQKRALLSLLLVAAMLLSGCALVVTDTTVDNARVVLDVNGQTINKATMAYQVSNTIEQNEYYNNLYYQYFGMNMGYDTNQSTVFDTIANAYIDSIVQEQKAKELGFDQLTEEELAEVTASAQADYDEMIETVKTEYLKSTAEGDELTAEAVAYAEAQGFYKLENYVESYTIEKSIAKLKADSIKEVAVTEDELVAALATKAESGKSTYENSLSSYGYAVNNGTTTYYAPEGYRYVKQILVKFQEADSTAMTEAKTALTTASNTLASAQAAVDAAAEDADMDALNAAVTDAQAAMDAAQAAYDAAEATAFANIQERVDEVYGKIQAGEDFIALMEDYNEDPGMQSEPGKTNGYAICEGYTYFDSAFTNAAMALANVGDVTEPIKSTSYGYYIIRYESDITPGEVALDTVRAALETELLTTKQDAAYTEVLTKWIADSKVTIYKDRMGY